MDHGPDERARDAAARRQLRSAARRDHAHAPAVELPRSSRWTRSSGAAGALSARPELARWLATDPLLLQMAAAIDRVARGATPAADLKVLAPAEAFTPATRGRVREIGPDSFRRYDGLAETLAGIDPAADVRAYRTIQPRLDEAYTRLGRAESGVDVAVRQALGVLIATPIPDGPLRIEEGRGATWRFADPTLESLPPAQKQLLRMGPQNAPGSSTRCGRCDSSCSRERTRRRPSGWSSTPAATSSSWTSPAC